MTLGNVLAERRMESNIGIRELCRAIEASHISGPVSPSYLSRIERDSGEIESDHVSIDTLWSLGVAMEIDPLLLFVLSRPDLSDRLLNREIREKLFLTWDVPDVPLGVFLRARRHDLGITMSEVEILSHRAPHATFGISTGFLSQVETDFRGASAKISGDKLWALGVVLRVDPLALFVLSRRLGSGLVLRRHRLFLFKKFSL